MYALAPESTVLADGAIIHRLVYIAPRERCPVNEGWAYANTLAHLCVRKIAACGFYMLVSPAFSCSVTGGEDDLPLQNKI